MLRNLSDTRDSEKIRLHSFGFLFNVELPFVQQLHRMAAQKKRSIISPYGSFHIAEYKSIFLSVFVVKKNELNEL